MDNSKIHSQKRLLNQLFIITSGRFVYTFDRNRSCQDWQDWCIFVLKSVAPMPEQISTTTMQFRFTLSLPDVFRGWPLMIWGEVRRKSKKSRRPLLQEKFSKGIPTEKINPFFSSAPPRSLMVNPLNGIALIGVPICSGMGATNLKFWVLSL